ncbi:MAG: hypothetical protein HQL53_03580 [Magnetococcales bacterium]|nr:hypothetical protein [Magnetococcales bacterium]
MIAGPSGMAPERRPEIVGLGMKSILSGIRLPSCVASSQRQGFFCAIINGSVTYERPSGSYPIRLH